MADPVCARCGDAFALRVGYEPTQFCNRCSHVVVDDLRVVRGSLHAALAEVTADRDEWMRRAARATEDFDKCMRERESALAEIETLRARVAELEADWDLLQSSEAAGEATSPKVICAVTSDLCYPEVMNGADKWLWSDDPIHRTMRVTEDGLRRLLRLVSRAQGVLAWMRFRGHPKAAEIQKTWERDVEPAKIHALHGETCSIFCEGSLVMSRLFTLQDGSIVRHQDDEVDGCAKISNFKDELELERAHTDANGGGA